MMRAKMRFHVGMGVTLVMVALFGSLLTPAAQGAEPVTTRLSISDTEAQAVGGNSTKPAMSADGRFVAFLSDATNLVTGDSNAVTDVFVRDRLNGTTERASVSSAGAQADTPSDNPRISSDGRFVVFDSEATTLVSPHAGAIRDVFIRDRVAGTTAVVSVNSAGDLGNGASARGDVSADGNLVVFSSDATNLIAPDGNAGAFDVFVRNRSAGTTSLVSLSGAGVQGNGSSGISGPRISDDGRIVTFESAATNLVSGDANAKVDVFVRDLVNNGTERVSTSSGGAEANGDSGTPTAPDISADGRYVAFTSAATDLVTPDAGGYNDIFRKDRQTGSLIRASQKSDGTQANDTSGSPDTQGGPQVSPDGRFVAFPSLASNLVSTGSDTLMFVDIFVHDGITRQTVRVSEGSEANGVNHNPAISGGSEAAWNSGATNLLPGGADNNGFFDVYARHFRRPVGSFVLDNLGGIFTFGAATFRGSVPALRASGVPVGSANIVDLEVTPSGNGYYVLDDLGGIFSFGDAAFFGSVPGLRAGGVCTCPARIIDMAVTPTGQGYLILDEAGGIFTFGDAAFFGSIPQLRAAGVPVGPALGVDLSLTPTGNGYLILDDTGGIFTFGDARFFGSLPGLRAGGAAIGSAPSIRMATSPSGNGYLILDNVGGMFTFGDAQFFGSIPGLRAAGVPIGNAAGVDLAITPTGLGYVILDDQGGMFTFGDGEFFGSIPQLRNAGVAIGPNTSIRVDLVSAMVGG